MQIAPDAPASTPTEETLFGTSDIRRKPEYSLLRDRVMKAQNSPDDFQTPPVALNPLIPYLCPLWTIWEPAAGKGNLVRALCGKGFDVEGSDIRTGQDFLTWKPEYFDCIITNPPFSLKDDFLERAYDLGVPFAFLLPLTTFEGKRRQKLFAKHGLEVIFLDKRIHFETPSGKQGGSWFSTAWFTHGLEIGRQITFAKLNPAASSRLNGRLEL